MAKITYMPHGDDRDTVEVAGISFKAYEPTEVDDKNADLVMKLKRNPWFTDGEIDADRKTAWENVRAAQQKAKEHRAEAERLERSLAL